MTPNDFSRLARLIEQQIRDAVHEMVEHAAKLIAEDAKENIIGHGLPEWPEFAERTEADPRRKGPLLREGKLKDSIEYEVTQDTAEIGSNDPNAIIQEHGDSRQPPRPFLMSAAMRKEKEIVEELERRINEALGNS